MKKLFAILLSIMSLTIMAQVPQGVGYQGVATDANGIELVNQSISIRASVLSGSATGTIEWEETHATSTDTFGLFTLTIGQGTSTTNGAQISFADISWGTNTHFLKIEMDVTGGTNYSFMGTNQMMSVPYALYAENANINYDSISNILSNDSTFITTVGGGMGGGGCNYSFPDGLEGNAFTRVLYNNPYTVPVGKRLYLTSISSNMDIDGLDLNPVNFGMTSLIPVGSGNNQGPTITTSLVIINSGQTISSSSNGMQCSGILINENIGISAINLELNNPYTVPLGKKLYILNDNTAGFYGAVVNGTSYERTPHFLNSGDIISSLPNMGNIQLNGYLADENYFAGCGGGSSSTSSLDSTTIANMIAGAGGGCDLSFPEGLGDLINLDLNPNQHSYTVPPGKRLYVTHFSNTDELLVDNVTLYQYNMNFVPQQNFPIVVDENQIISKPPSNLSSYSINIRGFLVDISSNLIPITYSNAFANTGTPSSGSYNIPIGKLLIVNFFGVDATTQFGNASVNILGNNFSGYPNPMNLEINQPIILNSNDTLNLNGISFNGYLVDENYFAGCGGGGSSSGTGNMVVSTFGDTLTLNGQSIIVPGISFSNVVPIFGSVTDIDGNTYPTVSYGNVEWMTENLTTTTFSDGTPISQICQCDNGGSCFCNQPGWCNYTQNPSFDAQYGKLYTGYTIASNSNVCPTGWHVSNSNDWDMLTDLFVNNGVGTNGVGTTSGNATSLLLSQTNESYLSLQLGGYNNGCGGGSAMGSMGEYWITDPNWNNGNAHANINQNSGVYYIYLGSASVYNYKYIRCVKD